MEIQNPPHWPADFFSPFLEVRRLKMGCSGSLIRASVIVGSVPRPCEISSVPAHDQCTLGDGAEATREGAQEQSVLPEHLTHSTPRVGRESTDVNRRAIEDSFHIGRQRFRDSRGECHANLGLTLRTSRDDTAPSS